MTSEAPTQRLTSPEATVETTTFGAPPAACMAGAACLLYVGMGQEGSDTGSLSARAAPKLAW